MPVGVEVPSSQAQHHREQEEQKTEEPHQPPAPGGLPVIGPAVLDNLLAHVVEQENSHIAGEDHQDGS